VPSRAPEVLLADFGASAITYRIRVWTTDFAADERLRDRLRSAIYYAFKRAGIVIPYPIQVEIPGEPTESAGDPALVQAVLRRVGIFSALDDKTIGRLAETTRAVTFAAGETIVRQGDVGTSMFVIVTGEAVVLLSPGAQEVARLREGAFFGEMSLLTGAVRTATVKSVTDVEVLELTGAAFRSFVLGNPVVVELIGAAVAQRAAELEQARQSVPGVPVESAASLVGRVRRFLRL
ncbi:MAG: cyclic nucleotide-binding domain-containing protein, partial [Vicinamibacterales bacterium]